jgi:hypothetical protein
MTEIEIKIKTKIKIKGSGQECPLHSGVLRQESFTTEGTEVHRVKP